MRCVTFALCLLWVASPVLAQTREESAKDSWIDKLDPDVDCSLHADLAQCRGGPVIEVGGSDQPVRPRAQIIAGSVMVVLGPAFAATSSLVFLDGRQQQISTKRDVEYVMGGIMSAAGVAITIGGAATLRKGIVRRREEAEMGLALGPTRLDFHVRF